MLPTAGLFRTIPCPYFTSGLCERPHCPFRHAKSDVTAAFQAQDDDVVIVSEVKVKDTAAVGPGTGRELRKRGPEEGAKEAKKRGVDDAKQEVKKKEEAKKESKEVKKKGAEDATKETKKIFTFSSKVSGQRDKDVKEKEKRRRSDEESSKSSKSNEEKSVKKSSNTKTEKPSISKTEKPPPKTKEVKSKDNQKPEEQKPKNLSEPITIPKTISSGVRIGLKRPAETPLLPPPAIKLPKKSFPELPPETGAAQPVGRQRVAHVAAVRKPSKRPSIIVDSPSKSSKKIPVPLRQKVLDQIFDAAVNIYEENKLAFDRAIEEEAKLESRSKAKNIYLSLAVGIVRTIRKEAEAAEETKANPPQSPTKDETQRQLSGGGLPLPLSGHRHHPRPVQPIIDVINTKPLGNRGLPGSVLYEGLKRAMLTEEQLVANGFPRPHPTGEPDRAIAELGHWERPFVSEALRRTCDRCRKVYDVTEAGDQAREDSCTFHPGRKNYSRVNRTSQSALTCCGDEGGSQGCTTSTFHVPKAHPVSATKGFVSAIKENGREEMMGLDPWDMVAIDCEMVYTTEGNSLARVTVIGRFGEVLYDELVKPSHTILDYNTMYSGLTEQLMRQARVTVRDVQAVFLARLKPNSIIIGHSVESDLIALRIKHDLIVDTSVLYPHRRGHPYKRALRTLTCEVLRRIIQESVDGHDSAEDARAAFELAVLKVESNL